MTTPRPSLTLRLVHSSINFALRFWPEESRHWGHALAAELDEIEKPFEALQWALGGLMLFARASASRFLTWLKLPAGSRLSAASFPSAAGAPVLPKRSRLFTAAILLGSTVLFFLPQSREAISTVRASWREFSASSSDLRAVENLGIRAEKEKDARTLAFVSLILPDSERGRTFADRAVALDPSLVWIYAGRVGGPSQDELARLLESDSDNAVPELLVAHSISETRFQALISSGKMSDQAVVAALASDHAWVAHMDQAFRAPRYDSYFSRDWQLTREVWNREHTLSPSIAFCSLWSHSFPDNRSIKIYANVLIRNSQEAFAAGHPQEAKNLLEELDSFGRRLTEQSETYFERAMGLDLSRRATSELRSLYRSAGKADETEAAGQHLQQIESRRDALVNSFRDMEPAQLHMLQRRAIFVQLSAVFAVLLVVAIAASLLTLELRPEKKGNLGLRLRGLICLGADWAPVTLLAVFIALLWAFQPFAGILRAAHSAGSASAAWHTMHFEGLFILSTTLGPFMEPFTPYHLWQASTCVLVAFVLCLLLRSFLRHKPA
jgi:hypothetical protein